VKRGGKWIGWLAQALAAIAIAIAVLAWVPGLFIPSGELDQSDRIRLLGEGAIRSTAIQLAGAAIVAIGILYTAGQLRISRETHYTERYAKAIDQLGHSRPIVRVGAMFALRRLAENSAFDGPVVVEVLRSYLRLESPRPTTPEPGPGRIPPDVQIALNILLEMKHRDA
jgi:hypothetical protein